jgi:hypothetical protein
VEPDLSFITFAGTKLKFGALCFRSLSIETLINPGTQQILGWSFLKVRAARHDFEV